MAFSMSLKNGTAVKRSAIQLFQHVLILPFPIVFSYVSFGSCQEKQISARQLPRKMKKTKGKGNY